MGVGFGCPGATGSWPGALRSVFWGSPRRGMRPEHGRPAGGSPGQCWACPGRQPPPGLPVARQRSGLGSLMPPVLTHVRPRALAREGRPVQPDLIRPCCVQRLDGAGPAPPPGLVGQGQRELTGAQGKEGQPGRWPERDQSHSLVGRPGVARQPLPEGRGWAQAIYSSQTRTTGQWMWQPLHSLGREACAQQDPHTGTARGAGTHAAT